MGLRGLSKGEFAIDFTQFKFVINMLHNLEFSAALRWKAYSVRRVRVM